MFWYIDKQILSDLCSSYRALKYPFRPRYIGLVRVWQIETAYLLGPQGMDYADRNAMIQKIIHIVKRERITGIRYQGMFHVIDPPPDLDWGVSGKFYGE